MKKLLLIAGMLLSFAASAATLYVTTCGVQVIGRDMKEFNTAGEFYEYCLYLNKKYCSGDYSEKEDIEISSENSHDDACFLLR